ncbi:27093_t:CDS:2, partial [Racocetra persica]
QGGVLHYEKLEPCEIMCRYLIGDVRLDAKIVPDDYQKPTMIQIIGRFSNIFDFELSNLRIVYEGLTNKKDIFLYYPLSAQDRERAHKDFILDTDVCKKYENYVYEISNKHYAYCAAKM